MADDQTTTQPTDQTTTTSATTTALGDGLAKATDPTTSPPASQDSKPSGPPEKYETWKLPDGYELDAGVSEEAAPLFKELGLSQDQAQKLVDLYSKHAIKSAEEHNAAGTKWWNDRQQAWRDELRNDPQVGKLVGSNGNFGPDSPLVQTVNRALDGLQNPKLAADFKEAMDSTGAGNNPAFVKVLYALASKVTEGTDYVVGGVPKGNSARPSPAAAMYPNLQSEADRR